MQKDDDDYQTKRERDELPDNTDKDYRDVAQPVRPAYGAEDDYEGVGVTHQPLTETLEGDEVVDALPDPNDPSVRLLVIGGGVLREFYVVAVIGAGWIEEDISGCSVGGCLDDIDIDDPPEAGMWLFTGRVVTQITDYDAEVSYEGEYRRPMFHEALAFGTQWVPVQERTTLPLPVGEEAPI